MEIQDETVESILEQDFSHLQVELIIVLSGNSSPRNEIFKIFSEKNLPIRVFDDLGKGLGAARQIIVEKARGEFIVWIDSDVKMPSDFLRNQFEFMRKNSDVGVAIGVYDAKEFKGRLIATVFGLLMAILRVVYFGATITRTDALREVGGFDRRIQGASEDVDLVTRLVIRNWKVAFNNEAKFSRELRETLQDIFRRGIWYGRGGHFLNCKYKSRSNIPRRLPPFHFLWGVKLSVKTYRKIYNRKAFFLPVITLVQSIGWSVGYCKAHFAGYGHSISNHEIDMFQTKKARERMNKMLSY